MHPNVMCRASDRMRKKIKDYSENFGHIMRKHALIMQKFKQFIELIVRPVQTYLYAYGKSVLEIATNTVVFTTEFFPFAIKSHG